MESKIKPSFLCVCDVVKIKNILIESDYFVTESFHH